MSLGGFLDDGNSSGGARVVVDIPPYSTAAMPAASGGVSQLQQHQRLLTPPLLPKYMFSSTGLSLGLQTNIDGAVEMMNRIGSVEFDATGRGREDEYESRSGSDNVEAGSGDDLFAENPPGVKRKRYHRHTPQQIQELEALFKECPHPEEKQRLELSKRLCLESRQVKFWFQNRRTQMKTQLERHENSILRQENDKLRAENMSIRESMRNPICTNCNSPAMLGEVSLEEQHLRFENARLKDELDRVCNLAGKFLGRHHSSIGAVAPPPQLPMPNSSLALGVGGGNEFGVGFGSVTTNTNAMPPVFNFVTTGMSPHMSGGSGLEGSIYLEVALMAMDELMKMVQMDAPLWSTSLETGTDTMSYEEYDRLFPRCIGPKPDGFVSEATRETGTVNINSLSLVDTLMDANRWSDIFSCMIARASTTDIISSGLAGTRNGVLQLMHAELQVLSPLIPIREVNFLRFCKQQGDGVWAVVDVSVDSIRDKSSTSSASNTFMSCRRLPSGCVVQDMPNGYSKVTWLEHAEYDESSVHQLYRSLLRSGMGFGAQRWLATLHRQCECLAILMSSTASSRENTGITAAGRRSMLKLAQRMTDNFCTGVCPSTVHEWNRLRVGTVDEDVRVMTRKSVDDPGEPSGVVLSAATSVWLPVSSQRVFDFLRDEHLRSEWDVLSNGVPMQEMAHIAKGQDQGNCVSLLRVSAMNVNQNRMLILQETCTDASGSLVVYAPVDIPAMQSVMSGDDYAYVALLPSGFAIVPNNSTAGSSNISTAGGGETSTPGSLLTVAFQILVNSLPTAKLTVESVETVNNLISCTVQKIKAALHCEN